MAFTSPILKEVRDRSDVSTTAANQLARALKRCIDAVLSAFLILLLLPLFLTLGIIVFIDDGWPVIFRRRVLGRQGEFDAFKFRSMRRDADEILRNDPTLRAEFERNFKLKVDPRLTRSGDFLRKHSLDELPQLFNVLAGQMSLVGPRMITKPELHKYGAAKDLLLTVRPGITGFWQINGRQDVNYEERVRMDTLYIRHWSLWMDIKILCLTPLKVIQRKGAY
jgi:lipopolysaccharide/colanic/teichoic acid biosynthesis glycosyltransferase